MFFLCLTPWSVQNTRCALCDCYQMRNRSRCSSRLALGVSRDPRVTGQTARRGKRSRGQSRARLEWNKPFVRTKKGNFTRRGEWRAELGRSARGRWGRRYRDRQGALRLGRFYSMLQVAFVEADDELLRPQRRRILESGGQACGQAYLYHLFGRNSGEARQARRARCSCWWLV